MKRLTKPLVTVLIASTLLATGCSYSTSTANQELYGYSDTGYTVYTPKNYTYNEEIVTTWEDLSNTLELGRRTNYETYSSLNLTLSDIFNNVATLDVDSMRNDVSDGYNYLLTNPMLNTINDSLIPGLLDFIKGVAAEPFNKATQYTVMNNTAITMYPMHLFGDSYGLRGTMLQLKHFNNVLTSPLWQQLAEGVPQDLFVTPSPLEGKAHDILQFATPSFALPTEAITHDNDDNSTYHYAENALNYHLYTTDDTVEKIRLVINRPASQLIEDTYFSPLRYWGKEIWQMSDAEQQDLDALLLSLSSGVPKKSSGTIGNYQYTVQVLTSTPSFYSANAEDIYNITLILAPSTK